MLVMTESADPIVEKVSPAITRLDYFAAMALQGFLSHEGTRGMSQALAVKAYELAKHMVEEAKRHQA
jgi:hypothetical protein